MRKYYPILRELLVVCCTVGGLAIGWCAGTASGIEQGTIIGAFTGMGVFGAFADIALRR